jgi:hypothetical protein
MWSILAASLVCGTEPEGAFSVPDPPAAGVVHRTFFMNRNGGTYVPGDNDSVNNTSTIPEMVSTIPPYPYSEASWQAFMECSRAMWAPFNVTITDEDPGAVAHIECVVGGSDADIGRDGILGVSPSTCGILERSIVYVFAADVGNDPQYMCEIAAQEIAHSLGLDHEYLCEDPMTYLSDPCGPRTFQDVDAQCGEFVPRGCACTGATQNSFRLLLNRLGASENEPPFLEVVSPQDGDTVPRSFLVDLNTSDNVRVWRTELFVDGERVGFTTQPPYDLQSPPTVALGTRMLEVRSYDLAANFSSVMLSVTVVPGCEVDADCQEDYICLDQACVGDIGAGCQTSADCASGLCLLDDVTRFCSDFCESNANCPSDFHCANDDSGGTLKKCYPGGPPGCSTGGRTGAGMAGLFVFAIFLMGLRRRR